MQFKAVKLTKHVKLPIINEWINVIFSITDEMQISCEADLDQTHEVVLTCCTFPHLVYN